VVDDHTMVRQGLATLINDDERTTVVGEASDGLEAIEATERYQPDVILIDVNMPRMNGIEATREICRRWPNQIVIGLSVQADDTTADLMLKAGAKAFLSKGGNADHLIETIVGLNGQGRVARSVGGAVT
jgi:two-component system, NarL family, response regulator DegU